MEFLNVDDAVVLMHMEYAEMPGLRLTFAQARRMWNLTDDVCVSALATLMQSGYLERRKDGTYIRAGSSTAGMDRMTPLVA